MAESLARLRRLVFERHSNPWSAWSRLLTTPLILVPFWTRRPSHFAAVVGWMTLNAVVFPAPADDSNWATRAMLGEEQWLEAGQLDRVAAVNAVASVLLTGSVIAAWKHRLVPAAALTAGMIGLTLYQWQLMAESYDPS
ncbi:MAG: hypothetical protein GEV07_03670 [Streptosporangiales bacterium]|nr:hypothetical protein [Streptosporangiales bacterium]